MSMEESHWDSTHVEDVFLPSVRVQLKWADVEAAVEQGAIVPATAHMLWANWAAPGAATRMRAEALAVASALDSRPAELYRMGQTRERDHRWVKRLVYSPFGLAVAALMGGVITVLGLLYIP